MGRIEETDRTIDLITNSYPCKTQEYLILKEIARSIAVLADNIAEPVKPFNVVNKDNFINDWTAGNDTAKEDIKKFCQKEIVKSEHVEDPRDMYFVGYRYGLCKVLEYIERI